MLSPHGEGGNARHQRRAPKAARGGGFFISWDKAGSQGLCKPRVLSDAQLDRRPRLFSFVLNRRYQRS